MIDRGFTAAMDPHIEQHALFEPIVPGQHLFQGFRQASGCTSARKLTFPSLTPTMGTP